MPGTLRGRKVTEVKPVVHGTQYESSISDLQKAWDVLGKTKSSFRHVEHKLDDAERHAVLTRRDITPIDQSDSSVTMDRIPSYEIKKSDVRHNKNNNRKTRGPHRKTSHIDDKYSEKKDIVQTGVTRTPLKRVDFNDQPQYWSSETRDTERSHDHGLSSYDLATDPTPSHNTTDYRAIRDTDIRFLNEHTAPSRVMSYDRPTKFTHVNLPPSYSRGMAPTADHRYKDEDHRLHQASTDHDINTSLDTSTASVRSRQLRKSLHDFKNSDDERLNKLKEKIRQQRMNMEQKEKESEMMASRVQHTESDPVLSKTFDIHEEKNVEQPIRRKVAVGPATPSYKGFTEPETRIKTPDGKIVKLSDNKRTRKTASVQLFKKTEDKKTPNKKNDRPQSRNRKPERKVAEAVKRPSKFQGKDIITTRSWREGQKLIRDKLGPAKLPKMSLSPPTKDTSTSSHTSSHESESDHHPAKEDSGHMQERGDESEEFIDSLEPGKAKALSEQAKGVLADLNASDSEEETKVKTPEKNTDTPSKKKKTVIGKRKAQEPIEEERKYPVAKIRHYDADEIRQYMAKRAAKQKKQQMEDRKKQQTNEQHKRRALDDLYKKQKETARKPISKLIQHPPSPGPSRRTSSPRRPPRPRGTSDDIHSVNDETFFKDLSDLPRRHPFQDDAYKVSTGSDKENHLISDSESSTLTEDSADQTMQDDRNKPKTKDGSNSDASLDVDDIITKYGEHIPEVQKLKDAVKEIQSLKKFEPGVSSRPHPISSLPSHVTSRPYSVSSLPHRPEAPPRPYTSTSLPPRPEHLSSLPARDITTSFRPSEVTPSGRPTSRQERILAIQNQATSLQNRLKQASHHIQAGNWGSGTRWAHPRHTEELDTSYRSRHEQITRPSQDYRVFTDDLPGVRNLTEHARQVNENTTRDEAAKRIQAAYRGHTVRQSMGWRLPSGKTLGPSHLRDDLSDVSLTESEASTTQHDRSHNTIGAALRGTDYCVGAPPTGGTDTYDRYRKPSAGMSFSEPMLKLPVQQPYSLEPQSDPHSVINIFTRRWQLEQERIKNAKVLPDHNIGHTSQTTGQELSGKSAENVQSAGSYSRSRSEHSLPTRQQVSPATRGASRAKSDRPPDLSKSPLSSHSPLSDHSLTRKATQDKVAEATQHRDASKSSQVDGRSSNRSPYRADVKKTSSKRGDDVDTSADTSEDFESSRSPPAVSTSMSLVPRGRHESNDSDVSSPADNTPRRDPLSLASKVSAGGSLSPPSTYQPRLSPNTLERRMMAELNLLEGMEESVRQVTNVERARAVSLAQQESVSLAQILKGRQQEHDRELQSMQMKARQESILASQQLEEARKKASEAALKATQTMAEVRNDAAARLQDSTQKLIESQAEAAIVTAEAARQLAQAKHATVQQTEALHIYDSNKMATETATAAASAAVTAALDMQRQRDMDFWKQARMNTYDKSIQADSYKDSPTQATASYSTDSFHSPSHSQTKSYGTGSSVKTASDMERVTDVKSVTESVNTDMTDRYEADKTISEDLHTDQESVVESVADYSLQFDDSITEDEKEDQSFRCVLPSETHRKRAKKDHALSDRGSPSSDDLHHRNVESRALDDLSSPFTGDESFTKFTAEMVKQYMKEEEIRAQHQASLLVLREKALKEKTKAELAWLEQQKKRIRDKKADDAYPQIRKKQRGLIMRLQQEQAEIKRLQEANRAASQERRLILRHQQEITKMKQSAQKTKAKLKEDIPDEGGDSVIPTEDDNSLAVDDTSDIPEDITPRLESKSESEVYTEAGSTRRTPSPGAENVKMLQKIKRLKLDERFLTKREQKLRQRRKQAEDLLAWKRRLDAEEQEVYKMEKKAMQIWKEEPKEKKKTEDRKEEREQKAPVIDKSPASASIRTDSILSPQVANVSGSDSSIAEDVALATVQDKSESSVPEDIVSPEEKVHLRHSGSKSSVLEDITPKSRPHSGSESSIPEDVRSRSSSVAEQLVTESPTVSRRKSGVDSPQNSSVTAQYSSDTFISENSNKDVSAGKLSQASPSPVRHDSNHVLKSPRTTVITNRRRESGSESEDSFIYTQSETPSDQSDVEGRIRALNDQLKHRKIEAERLKREQKKKHKERMKAKEASLKKQLEAYENLIKQMKEDLQQELEHEPCKTSVKPQIKQPTSRSSRLKHQVDLKPVDKHLIQRSESESSKSSHNGNDDVIKDKEPESYTGFSSTASPSLSPKLDDTLIQLPTPSPMKDLSKRLSLGSLSESIHSVQSPGHSVCSPQSPAHSLEDAMSPRTDLSEKHSLTRPVELELSPIPAALKADNKTVDKESHDSSKKVADAVSPSIESVKSDAEEISEDIEAADQKSDISSHSDLSNRSFTSSQASRSRSVSEKSIDKKSKSPSEKSVDDNYSEDFSDASVTSNKSERSVKSQHSHRSDHSVKSDRPRSRHSDHSERIRSRSDSNGNVSEEISDHSDDTEKSVQMLDLTGKEQIIDEDRTPVSSPHLHVKPIVADTKVDDEEHTLTEDASDKSADLTYDDDFEDQAAAEEDRSQVAPYSKDDLSSVSSRVTGEASEISTDRELDKLIKSAAESVERFGSVHLSLDDDDEESKATPRGAIERDFEAEEPRDNVVNTFTDRIASTEVNDAIDTVIPIWKDRRAPEQPQEAPSKPKVKPHTPLLDLLTRDQDSLLEQDISSEESIKEQSLTASLEGAPPETVAEKKTQAADNIARALLNESISDIIRIRNEKKERLSAQTQTDDRGTLCVTPPAPPVGFTDSPPKTPVSPESDQSPIHSPRFTRLEVLLTDDIFKTRNHLDSSDKPAIPLRPLSPTFDSPANQLDQLFSGSSDEFIDDDFGFPVRTIPDREPPPYPGSRTDVSKFDLQKLAEEPFFAIPNKKSEIEKLVSDTVNTYWNQRRYGEPLDAVEPPDDYFAGEDKGSDIESKNRKVYKKMLFKLTGEIIQDIYKEEEEDSELPPWVKPKRQVRKYYKGKSAPTTVDELKHVVQEQVSESIGIAIRQPADPKWGSRKKKDQVDGILVQELREDEPTWIDYDEDELAVKNQLTDAIFESLLTETGAIINTVIEKRKARLHQDAR